MVSAGDTDISLHMHPGPTQKPLTGGGGPDQPNPKWQDLSKSASGGGKEGWGGPDQLNPKCQDLSKSAFSGGAGGVVLQTNIPEIFEWGYSKNVEPKILEV